MAAEVEVRVRATGHGAVHQHRKEEPDVVRAGNGDRNEALRLLDAMVAKAREELGAPPVPPVDGAEAKAYGWMRETLHGVAKALGVTAPHMPAANERDEKFGADLVGAVRSLVSNSTVARRWDFLRELGSRLGVVVGDYEDTGEPVTSTELHLLAALQDVLDRSPVDARAALTLTPQELAELTWNAGVKVGGGRTWAEFSPEERGGGQVDYARELLRLLAERGRSGDVGAALAVSDEELAKLLWYSDAEGARGRHRVPFEREELEARARAFRRLLAGHVKDSGMPVFDATEAAQREAMVTEVREGVAELSKLLGIFDEGQHVREALLGAFTAVRDLKLELTRSRVRAADRDRLADTAWALIQDATQGPDEPDDEEWKSAALRWHDSVFGEGTVPPDNRWLVDRYVREHDMVLVSGEEARRLRLSPASAEGVELSGAGSFEFTSPAGTWTLRPDEAAQLRWFTADPKSVDAELTDRLNAKANGIAAFLKAWRGDREQRVENITRAYAEGRILAEPSKWLTNGELTAIVGGDESLVKAWREDRLRVVADPAAEGSNPVTLRVGKGAGMPVILDAGHPHGSFSLRASRPKGDIAPGGPLDLGDGVTTVDEIGRALARFDKQFPVSRHAAVTTLPQRIHELVDRAEQLRGEPARRTLVLANLLGLTREERGGLFEGKDEEGRWNAVLAVAYERLGELRAVQDVLEGVVDSDASLNPDGGRTPSQVVALMADRQTVWAASAADELGDPGVDVLAAWLEFALKQGEGKTGVQVGDAAGFSEWKPLLRVAAEHVLLCAAGVRAETPDDSMDRMVTALVDNLMLPSIELQELRELLERTAPVSRWSMVLKMVQERCLAFYGIKGLVQPWNGTMKRPEDVTEAVRVLAQEKHAAQEAEDMRGRIADHGVPREFVGAPPVSGQVLGGWIRDAFGEQVHDDATESTGMTTLIGLDGFWHGVGMRVSQRSGAAMASWLADAFDPPSTTLTADQVRTAYRETLERLSGEREVFPVDAPEPGPTVLAVRELDHLDTDDGPPTDVLYARQSNNPAHWYATTGPLEPKRWDELNGNPLVDCTGEVDYITVPMEDHGKGYRVYRRSTGETLSEGPFFDVRSANGRVHELNTAARPMVLDCEHPRRHPAGRCADCGVPASESEE